MKIQIILRKFYKILDHLIQFPKIQVFAKDSWRVEKAKTIVQYFYIVSAFWFFSRLYSQNFVGIRSKDFFTIWINVWVKNATPDISQTTLIVMFVIGIVSGLLFYQYRLGRIIVFIVLLELASLQLSINRYPVIEWYPWLNTAFLLIFLPDFFRKKILSKEERSKFLVILWGVQALLLLIYTLTGIHKIVFQLRGSEISMFDPKIFSQILAYKLTKDLNTGLFGSLIAGNIVLSYPLYLGAVYLQVFSFWAAIRVSIQKWWAVGLILFHVGTVLMFDVVFLQMVLLVILLFLDSPFLKSNENFFRTIQSFPLFGGIFSYFVKKKGNK